jgi:hypothetical protein
MHNAAAIAERRKMAVPLDDSRRGQGEILRLESQPLIAGERLRKEEQPPCKRNWSRRPNSIAIFGWRSSAETKFLKG